MNIYSAAIQRMKPSQIDHRKSNLYLLMTSESMEIVREYRKAGGVVEEVIDSKTSLYWYHIPWAYTPYWQRYFRMITENYAWDFIHRNERNGRLADWSDESMLRTFAPLKSPPHPNLYPAIRGALESILSYYMPVTCSNTRLKIPQTA